MKTFFQYLNNKRVTIKGQSNELQVDYTINFVESKQLEFLDLKIKHKTNTETDYEYQIIIKTLQQHSEDIILANIQNTQALRIPLGVDFWATKLVFEITAYIINSKSCPNPKIPQKKKLSQKQKLYSTKQQMSATIQPINHISHIKGVKCVFVDSKIPLTDRVKCDSVIKISVNESKMTKEFWDVINQNKSIRSALVSRFKVKLSLRNTCNNLNGFINLTLRKSKTEIEFRREDNKRRLSFNWLFYSLFDFLAEPLTFTYLMIRVNGLDSAMQLQHFLSDNTKTPPLHQFKSDVVEYSQELRLEFESLEQREYFLFCIREKQTELIMREQFILGHINIKNIHISNLKLLIHHLQQTTRLYEHKMEKVILGNNKNNLNLHLLELLEQYNLPEIQDINTKALTRSRQQYKQKLYTLNIKENMKDTRLQEKTNLQQTIVKLSKKAKSKQILNRRTPETEHQIKALLAKKHYLMATLDTLRDKKYHRDKLITQSQGLPAIHQTIDHVDKSSMFMSSLDLLAMFSPISQFPQTILPCEVNKFINDHNQLI